MQNKLYEQCYFRFDWVVISSIIIFSNDIGDLLVICFDSMLIALQFSIRCVTYRVNQHINLVTTRSLWVILFWILWFCSFSYTSRLIFLSALVKSWYHRRMAIFFLRALIFWTFSNFRDHGEILSSCEWRIHESCWWSEEEASRLIHWAELCSSDAPNGVS